HSNTLFFFILFCMHGTAMLRPLARSRSRKNMTSCCPMNPGMSRNRLRCADIHLDYRDRDLQERSRRTGPGGMLYEMIGCYPERFRVLLDRFEMPQENAKNIADNTETRGQQADM